MLGFAAPAEELFYRGIVFGWVRERLRASAAVLVGGVLFGLSHTLFTVITGGSPAAVAVTLIELSGAGVVFCAVYDRTDNLVVVSLLHAITWFEIYQQVFHAIR